MKKTILSLTAMLLLCTSCGNKQAQVDDVNATEQVAEQTTEQSPIQWLTDDNFALAVADFTGDKDVYLGKKPCLIDFYADWCGPCKKISPVIDELAKKYEGQILFYKVNVDNSPQVANAYAIDAIPCLFFCKDGKMERVVGAIPAEEIETRLSALIGE